MKSFFAVVSVATTAAALNCEGLEAFNPNKNYARGDTVIQNGVVFAATASVLAAKNPNDQSGWLSLGSCDGEVEKGARAVKSEAESTVDCSSYEPWMPRVYTGDEIGKTVWDKGYAFRLNYYADASVEPKVPTPDYWNWVYVGVCKDGTMGQGDVLKVDCTGIPAWSGSVTYGSEPPLAKVYYNHQLFEQSYWTEGDVPDRLAAYAAWKYVGDCQPGTDSTPAPTSPYDMSDAKKEQVCHCCKGCAKLLVTGPVCVDVASKDDCFFAWCPDYNNYDEQQCEYIKETQQLFYYDGSVGAGNDNWPEHVYIPYIDGGLAEQPPIDELAEQLGVKFFILAFAQSGQYTTTVGCQGAIASVVPIKVGPTSWSQDKQANVYFYERIAKLRELGGDITLSFGGAMGVELADSDRCTKDASGTLLPEEQIVENLKNAYKEAVDFLKLTHIDFDIEGLAVSSVNRQTGWQYRFKAVKALEAEYPNLKVWWTLPILPAGLTLDGINFISDLFASGVRVDKINVMTMDYGDEACKPPVDMHSCEIQAIDSLAQQVFTAATEQGVTAQYGWHSKDDVYPFLGSTPMIGLNDQTTETYTLQNARDSMNVWKTTNRKLGIISNWSLTRDHPCNAGYVDCLCTSKDNQSEDYEYAKIFAEWTGHSG